MNNDCLLPSSAIILNTSDDEKASTIAIDPTAKPSKLGVIEIALEVKSILVCKN